MYRRMLLAAAMMAAAATGVATPAQADPGDIIVVTEQGLLNSVDKKGLQVECPNGLSVLGGGGFIHNGAKRVHLSNSAPVDGDTWTVGAAEIRPGDYTSSWRVHGFAICGPTLSGLEYVTTQSLQNSTSTRHARATCPGTKKLLSGGGLIQDATENVVLDDISYTSDLKNVDVWGVERETGAVATWSVHAFAVCVNANAVSNLNRVQVTSASNVNDKFVSADCGGQQVYGIGASQSLAAGHTLLQSLSATDIDGHIAVEADPTGVPNAWTATAQLICGDE